MAAGCLGIRFHGQSLSDRRAEISIGASTGTLRDTGTHLLGLIDPLSFKFLKIWFLICQIKVWYQNRRTKQRKEGHLEMPPLNPFIANGTNHAGTELMDRNPYHHYHPHHASHAMYHQILQSYSGQANLMKIAEDRQPIPDSHATQLSADPTAIEGSIFIRHHQL